MLDTLYTLDVACEIIPCARHVLLYHLYHLKDQLDPPRYMTLEGKPRKNTSGAIVDHHGGPTVRMLTERECLLVRERLLRPTRAAAIPRGRPNAGMPDRRVRARANGTLRVKTDA